LLIHPGIWIFYNEEVETHAENGWFLMEISTTTIPGPRGHIVLGSIPDIQRDRVQFLVDLREEYGDIARIRLGPFDAVVIFHPDDIQRVLQDNHRNYSKQTRTYDYLGLLVGNGLIRTDGDFWLRQRRLMQPAFHRQVINGLCDLIVSQTQEMLNRLESVAQSGQAVNFSHEMMNLALGIATQALFSTRLQDMDGRLGDAIRLLMKDTAFRFEHPFHPPVWFPSPHNREFNENKKLLDELVFGMIRDRRQHHSETKDLLDRLMEARLDEAGGSKGELMGMDDQQLRDELVTLILAGHETTAISLCWTLYLLSQNPDVEARLRRELDEVLSGHPLTLDDLSRLEYTRMVRDESMRLYPPAWLVERKAIGDDVLSGYRIPAGTTLGITSFVTHRHPKFWDDPDAFDPERFSPERSAGRHDYAYFPFGGGPRKCIGFQLALLETHIALAMMLQRFHFELEPGREVKWEPELSLRLKGGLWLRLTSLRRELSPA
jgi:cytochrome P450